MTKKLKYVRVKELNQFIIFPETIGHDTFINLEPISAGFCTIGSSDIVCWGESVSLKLKSLVDDSNLATYQYFKNF